MRLFYRAVVGIPSDRNWRYQLAGGINLMAALHRSSLLLRRNTFDRSALGVDYRRRRYRRHYLNILSAASTPDPFLSPHFPLIPSLSCLCLFRFYRNSRILFFLAGKARPR